MPMRVIIFTHFTIIVLTFCGDSKCSPSQNLCRTSQKCVVNSVHPLNHCAAAQYVVSGVGDGLGAKNKFVVNFRTKIHLTNSNILFATVVLRGEGCGCHVLLITFRSQPIFSKSKNKRKRSNHLRLKLGQGLKDWRIWLVIVQNSINSHERRFNS